MTTTRLRIIMKTLQTFMAMAIWTITIFFGLYLAGAHLHYRDPLLAVAISILILVTHMVNMAIYFRIEADRPYKWLE